MSKISVPGDRSGLNIKYKPVTEYKIRTKDNTIVTLHTTGKKARKYARDNNGVILSAVPMVHTNSIGTHRYLDYVLRNWTDTSCIPKGAKFVEGIKDEDFDRFYTSYLKFRFQLDFFREWMHGQSLFPGNSFEINVKDLLYDLPIAAKTMMLFQLGYIVGTYEFQPMNHRDGYYEHYVWVRRASTS